jgi:hypothetical protein
MKNLKKFTVLAIAAICIQIACTNPANAFTPWTNSSGSAANFDWANGGSDAGLFGDPDLSGGNTFVFFPKSFIAESVGGVIAEVSDTLTFDLIVHPGALVTGIQISEYGDYGILGNGSVDISSLLAAENLIIPQTESAVLTTNPTMPIYPDIITNLATGEWTANGGVSLNGWKHLRVTLSNDLIAISDLDSVATIQKKVVGDSVAITIIPEPATLVLLAGGMAYLRRKKN